MVFTPFFFRGLPLAVLHVWTQSYPQNVGTCPGLPLQLLAWNPFFQIDRPETPPPPKLFVPVAVGIFFVPVPAGIKAIPGRSRPVPLFRSRSTPGQRPQKLSPMSLQRRRERYIIFHMWKILNKKPVMTWMLSLYFLSALKIRKNPIFQEELISISLGYIWTLFWSHGP